MNRKNEFDAMIRELNQPVTKLDATVDRALKKLKTTIKVSLSVVFAICIGLCIIPQAKEQPVESPLVITAKAIGIDGQPYTANLTLGEQIQLSPADFPFDGYECYAFDLTLMDGTYLQLSAVDENWEVVLDTSIHYSGESISRIYWALTEGNDIAVISTDLQGNVLEAYKNGTAPPRMKGSSMLWRVNNDNMNRCIIRCFNENFSLIVSYYLQITEVDGLYYAQIVKIF